MSQLFRSLPAVDKLLAALQAEPWSGDVPRAMQKDLVAEFLDICREEIRAGAITAPESLGLAVLAPRLAAFVKVRSRPHFTRVLNATGVVIHTNLGRSLLAEEATEAVVRACRQYSNLEFDLATGKRGSRYSHVEEILCRVTGAEAGLVVNNNASAVLIVLDTLAKGREAVVSRGQLIEIGGSFRIPDVMAKSGATLVEVGTTNRTHLRDYANAITEATGVLLRVHTSNYRIVGFTKEVGAAELVELGRERGIPVVEDLGSGSFYDFGPMGFKFEPTVQETVAAGFDVVTFSGDKVLGGPQAGLIVGRKEIIDRIKKNPLNRAIRIDKMTLAALEATLRLYLDMDKARARIPTLAMITATPAELKSKARRLSNLLKKHLGNRLLVALKPGMSRVGGGSFPERDLPTTLVCCRPSGVHVQAVKEALLATEPPLVGRIEDDAFCLDPRTLAPDEFPLVAASLGEALSVASAHAALAKDLPDFGSE